MSLNPIIAQQVDTLLKTLSLQDIEFSKTFKENLAIALMNVANESAVKDDSKYLRIETHFKILLDKLQTILNDKQSVAVDKPLTTEEKQKFDQNVQVILEKLNIFKERLKEGNLSSVTLETVQDEYNKLQGVLRATLLPLSAHLDNFIKYLKDPELKISKEDQKKMAADISEAQGAKEELYSGLFDKLTAWAVLIKAPKAEKYFIELAEILETKDDMETVLHWLKISGVKEFYDINEDTLKNVVAAPRSQTPSNEQMLNALKSPTNIEAMLAALLTMVGKEQFHEHAFNPLQSVLPLFSDFYLPKQSKKEIIAQQQMLFLEACQWKMLVSKDQFAQTAAELLLASDIPKDKQSKIEDLIDMDANLHSSDPLRAAQASAFLHKQDKIELDAQQAQKVSSIDMAKTAKEIAVAEALAERQEIERQHASVTDATYAAAKEAMAAALKVKTTIKANNQSPTRRTGKMLKLQQASILKNEKANLEEKVREVMDPNDFQTPIHGVILDAKVQEESLQRHPKQ